MARRDHDGLVVEPGSDGDVEILDPLSPRSPNDSPSIEPTLPAGGRWRSAGLALGAVLVAGIAIVTLSVAGNSPPPEPPTPSVTTPPAPLDDNDRRQLEAAYGVRIGDGPGLVWEPVDWNIGSTDVRWLDDGFVADDGVTEWTIRPGLLGPSIGQRQSLLVSYPDYRLMAAEGARVLAPREGPLDHLLVFGFEDEPVRLELPASGEPVTDLLKFELFIDMAVIDATAVALLGGFATIDSEALSLRLGREFEAVTSLRVSEGRLEIRQGPAADYVDVTDAALTDVEIDILQSPQRWAEPDPDIVRFDLTTGVSEIVPVTFDMSWGDLGRSGDQFVLEWADDLAANNRSTSFGGRSWTTRRGAEDPYTMVSDNGRLYGLSPGNVRIARSIDGGTTWRRTANPLRNGTFLVVDDVIVLRDPDGQAPNGDDRLISVDAGEYDVMLSADGESFVLSDPGTNDVISSGRIGDAAGGAMYDALGNLYFEDPDTGERLLTLARRNIMAALDAAGVLTTPLIAMTRWTDDEADPAWTIAEATDMFGSDVLSVDFIAGDGHILAVVDTNTGPEFHLAATLPPLN
jgi:hypothetical protein